jgi:endonuclease YncB( thermonuclease family)
MMRVLAAFVVALAATVSASASNSAPLSLGIVASIADGDTLSLTSGERIRLVQIDTPEVGTGECYSRAAGKALRARVPVGSRVRLEADPRLDKTDRYRRLLRYVHRGTMNVNVALVRAGAAAPYFYGGDRGRYADRLMAEALRAKSARRGLWGACPRTQLDPYRAVDTENGGPPKGLPPQPFAPTGCDPNYSGGCVPPYPPDLDCADIRAMGLAPVRSIGSDPHGLDGDGDGVGCE